MNASRPSSIFFSAFVVAMLFSHATTLKAGSAGEGSPVEQRYIAELEKQQAKLGATSPKLAGCLEKLGGYYFSAARYDDALAQYRRMATVCSVPGSEKKLALALQQTLRLDALAGHPEAIAPVGKQWLAVMEGLGGPQSLQVADVLTQLAQLEAQSSPAEAESYLKRSLSILQKLSGADDPKVLADEAALTRIYLQQQDASGAEPSAKAVFDAQLGKLGPAKPGLDPALDTLADIYVAESRTADAIALCQQVLDQRVKLLGAQDPMIVGLQRKLSRLSAVKRKAPRPPAAAP
jgi:hypothetical protein